MPPPESVSAHQDTAKSPTPPRRFVPEVVESSTKSSSKPSRRKDHSPAEENASKSAKLQPEVVDASSAETSSQKDAHDQDKKTPKPRRFAPQVTEVTHKSSKDKDHDGTPTGHVRFKPQPVETTYGRNRQSQKGSGNQSSTDASQQDDEKKAPRKWAPEVLNTAKRSRRAGGSHETSEDFRTESGHDIHAREHQKHITGDAGGDGSDPVVDQSGEDGHGTSQQPKAPLERRRPIAALDGSSGSRSKDVFQSRKSSFRCPDLETIESSESERETASSSPSSSPGLDSPITASDSSFHGIHKYATRARESVDEHFGNYLLQLEAKRAEQRLQEQAFAAFPNSDFHEPVQHYVNDDQDAEELEIEDRPVTWDGFDEGDDIVMGESYRRESTRMPWEQLELQRHAEELEQERRANQVTAKKPSQSPWWNSTPGHASPRWADKEIRSMRDRARPPMLGAELVFPRSSSPEPARFDVTQGSSALRREMCYLTDAAEEERKRAEEGLWNTTPKTEHNTATQESRSTTNNSTKQGLWGGFCIKGTDVRAHNELSPLGPAGLVTPQVEYNVNPFEQPFSVRGGNTPTPPPTPPTEVNSPATQNIDTVMDDQADIDDQIELEYPDSFITQVYNYLSLGYPSLARPFDDELAKISGVPISELREDDARAKASPRGYIRLGPDFEGGSSTCHDGRNNTSETICMRWTALRLYVREWARQEKSMIGFDASGDHWGAAARRGSWGL